MKKSVCFGMLFLAVLLCACGRSASPETTLYDQGLGLISLMEEAAGSDTYLSALSASEMLTDTIQNIAQGDYTQPLAVYSVQFPENALFQFIGTDGPEGLSDALLKNLRQRMLSAVVSQINAADGVESLAVSSLLSLGTTFVNSTVTGDTLYLYTYENGYPVAVVFLPGQDGAVAASATFVLYPDFPSGSAGEIQGFFGAVPVEVSQIQP